MRLQVGVYRHTLPTINFIYNTDSAVNSINTISDLLSAINLLIPLESADGEWGLEDYVVDVAPKFGERRAYECLHFQYVQDVLREDDEVVIRGLSSDELRERRQGGRFQITSDGRHLFDGVAWGKRWRPQSVRPDVNIPPRKRRRLLLPDEEEAVEEEETLPQLQFLMGAQLGTLVENEDENEDEDDDDDYDFEDNEDSENGLEEDEAEDYGGEDKENHYGPRKGDIPLQIIAREEFQNADMDDSESTADHEGHVDKDEIQMLLNEAADLEGIEEGRNSEPQPSKTRSKRKRDINDDGTKAHEAVFEGFTLPPDQDRTILMDTEAVAAKLGPYPVESCQNGLQVNGHSAESEEDDDSSSQPTSSSGRSGSDSGDVSLNESASDSDDDSDSTSDSVSHSSSADTSSSGGSESDSEAGVTAKVTSNHVSEPRIEAPKQSADQAAPPKSAPGMGSKRTRQNNNRMKRRKRLQSLKMAGILPNDATFDDLRAYDAVLEPHTEAQPDLPAEQASSSPNADELRRRKEDLIARLNADSEDSDAERVDKSVPVRMDLDTSGIIPTSKDESIDPTHTVTEVADSTATQAPHTKDALTHDLTPKRARLDVASSRRMLFHSLGLRNPKTQAAEDALRAKLAQSVRRTLPRPTQAEQPARPVDKDSSSDENAWKKKLIVYAVECVYDGVVMPTPPFPFKQRWEVEAEQTSSTGSHQLRIHEKEHAADNQVEPRKRQAIEKSHMSEVQPAEPSNPHFTNSAEPRTALATTAETDDLPVPGNLNELPSLTEDAILKGAVIVFKQLHMNAKFEPEESSYRVARVTGVEDGIVDLVLSKQYRQIPLARYDDETGKRVFHGLDAPNDEEEDEDDGVREVRFQEMIDPKLIRAAHIKVPASTDNTTSSNQATQDQEESLVVLESSPDPQPGQHKLMIEEMQIDTPRKLEITSMVKDAGFDSALDDQLLEPIAQAEDHQDDSDSYLTSRVNSSNQWISSPMDAEASMTLDTSRIEGNANSSPDNEASPPTISMVETVDYPHVSQIDVEVSRLSENIASSSHQDAQRASPQVPGTANNNLLHASLKEKLLNSSQKSYQSNDSFRSEVPPSQDYLEAALDNGRTDKIDDDSSLGLRGGSGHSSLYNDEEATDSDSLPSLRALTSSQKQQLTSRASQLSPPPLRKSPRGKVKSRTHQKSSDSSSSQVSDMNYHTNLKASQSQSRIRLSQVPTQEPSVIDLTVSSEAHEPSDDNDKEYVEPSQQTRKSSRVKREMSGSQNRASARMMKSMLSSLGGRKSTTGRKKSAV